jgi:hypothetical protein
VLVDHLDRLRGLLVVIQIWRDLFLDVSLVPVVIHGDAGSQDEVGALKHGCWSGGGGSFVISRLRRLNTMAPGSMKHGDVSRSTCHSDMCLVACCTLVDDGASLDLAMVEARYLFQRASRWRWSVAAVASFGSECRKT